MVQETAYIVPYVHNALINNPVLWPEGRPQSQA
jgi:hypothetical protein